MSRRITRLAQKEWTTTAHYDIDGVEYNKNPDDLFYFPDTLTSDDAPIICLCENDRFILTYGSYEVFAECSACGAKESVYSG